MNRKLRSFVFAACLATAGCAALLPVVKPVADFAVCVTSDALSKKSLAQIQSDCQKDELAVVTTLLGTADAQVKATPAYGEAVGKAAAAYKAGASRDAGR